MLKTLLITMLAGSTMLSGGTKNVNYELDKEVYNLSKSIELTMEKISQYSKAKVYADNISQQLTRCMEDNDRIYTTVSDVGCYHYYSIKVYCNGYYWTNFDMKEIDDKDVAMDCARYIQDTVNI